MTLTGQPVKQPVHQRGGIFYGWWIVLVCSLFNLVVGGTFFYGFTAFFNPLREEFGWTSAQTALGFSLQRLEGGIAAPVVGFLFDRVGPRKLILFGMIAAGCGLLLMSRVQSLGWFYTAFLVTAVYMPTIGLPGTTGESELPATGKPLLRRDPMRYSQGNWLAGTVARYLSPL